MTSDYEKLSEAAKTKKIILFGATTSARDVIEIIAPKLNILPSYICDLKNDRGVSFAGLKVYGLEQLKTENPADTFILITTIFDKEAAQLLNSLKFVNHLSARAILNESINALSYWDNRYKNNYDTGIQSQGILLEKQIQFTNDLIDKHHLTSVIEWGCGDGHMLLQLHLKKYIGLDISSWSIKRCKEQFKEDSSKEFFLVNDYHLDSNHDLALSLGNVISSIPDRNDFIQYMQNLFNSSQQFVCIFSPDEESEQYGHIKAWKFSDYVSEHLPQWELIDKKETGYPYKPGDPLKASFFIYRKNN
jgi:hypothetical protein